MLSGAQLKQSMYPRGDLNCIAVSALNLFFFFFLVAMPGPIFTCPNIFIYLLIIDVKNKLIKIRSPGLLWVSSRPSSFSVARGDWPTVSFQP